MIHKIENDQQWNECRDKTNLYYDFWNFIRLCLKFEYFCNTSFNYSSTVIETTFCSLIFLLSFQNNNYNLIHACKAIACECVCVIYCVWNNHCLKTARQKEPKKWNEKYICETIIWLVKSVAEKKQVCDRVFVWRLKVFARKTFLSSVCYIQYKRGF